MRGLLALANILAWSLLAILASGCMPRGGIGGAP
jgi:hypothetical protein